MLDFGNCWNDYSNYYVGGLVKAFLNGTVIASAPKNTPSVTVVFDFEIGSVLKIAEYHGHIIQFNSLDIIQCNEEIGNVDNEYDVLAHENHDYQDCPMPFNPCHSGNYML